MESSDIATLAERTSATEANVTGSSAIGNSTALDQWRGLALVFVLISHGFSFTGRVQGMGRVGVNLFFFISGLLVFRSLSKQRQDSGWELTRVFWKRRARRLYPALAVYVLAMFPMVLVWLHWLDGPASEWGRFLRGVPISLVYLVNYWPSIPISLAHLWSLSCEMQFYLLAPCIYLLGGRTVPQRRLVWGILLLVLATTGLVGVMLDNLGLHKYEFEIAVWPMMLGFYCEYRKDLFQRIPARWFPRIIIAGLVAFGTMTLLMFCGLGMKKPVIAIGTFAFIPCLLAYVGNRTLGGPIGRAMTWLGERTYSIYLWQQPLTICGFLPVSLHPIGAIISTFVGGLWFQWFERPFLSAGRKHPKA